MQPVLHAVSRMQFKGESPQCHYDESEAKVRHG